MKVAVEHTWKKNIKDIFKECVDTSKVGSFVYACINEDQTAAAVNRAKVEKGAAAFFGILNLFGSW